MSKEKKLSIDHILVTKETNLGINRFHSIRGVLLKYFFFLYQVKKK